jgi:hypothetical protein
MGTNHHHHHHHHQMMSICLMFECTEVVQGLLLIGWQQPTKLCQKLTSDAPCDWLINLVHVMHASACHCGFAVVQPACSQELYA